MRVPQVVTTAEELRNKKGKLKEAIELLKEHENKSSQEDLTFIKHALGVILHDLGMFDDALKKHKEALDLAKKTSNIFIEADSLRRIGWEYWVRDQNFEKTLDYQNQAWSIVKDHLDKPYFQRIASNINAAIGNQYYVSKKYDKAMKYYKDALVLAEKCSFYERVCTLKGDLANVYISQGKYNQAEKFLNDSYKFAVKNYRHAVPSLLIRKSCLYLLDGYLKKDYVKSEELLNKALKIVVKEGWKRDEAEIYDAFYNLYKKIGNKKLTEEHRKIALKIYRELGMKHRVKNLKRSN